MLNSWLGFNLAAALFLLGCSGTKNRPHYSREAGGYVDSPSPTSTKTTSPSSNTPKTESPKKRPSKLVDVAESYLGVPYSWGGVSRKGMDCSGFVKTVYGAVFDIHLPHSSQKMALRGKSISKGRLKKGDLVFFGSWMKVDHVGIYMGEGRFIHASESRGVMYSKLEENYFSKRFKGGRRIVN